MRSFSRAAAVLSAFILLASCGGDREGRKHMVPGLWQSDISDLFNRLEAVHPSPYSITPKSKFEDERAALVDSLAVWSDERIIVELSRLLAMVGDAETGIDHSFLEGRFRRLPVGLKYFGSELRVISAAPGYDQAVGKRLESIGGNTVTALEREIRPLVSRDNYAGWLVSVPRWLSYGEALAVLGFTRDRFSAEAVFVGDDGAELPLTLKTIDPDSLDRSAWTVSSLIVGPRPVGGTEAVIIDFAETPRPAASIRYSGPAEGKPDTGKLIRESMAELSGKSLLRLIIDLRGCGCGSGQMADAFTKETGTWLLERPGRDAVVLVDRHTDRSGLTAAARLGEMDRVTLAGELPGGAPNLTAERETYRLPNSGVMATLATAFQETVPRLKDSPWIPLDIHVKLFWEDHRTGYDAPLDTALACPPAVIAASGDKHYLKDMVLIPAAEFVMGGPESDIYAPGRKVFVDSFYIDRYEVTNAEYARFCEETGGNWPEFWGMDEYRCGPGWPDWPVVGVSLYQARLYAEWAGKRIPTEAEWELAARGGLAGAKFPTGDELLPTDANYRVGRWYIGTVPVGCYPPNGFGLYDMAGNVVEWVNDYFHPDYYREGPDRNPTGPEKGYIAVIRGGGWHSGRMCCNVYTRNACKYTWVDIAVGFRCAADIKWPAGS